MGEKKAGTPGINIARSQGHHISDYREGCPIRYETRFEIQEIENVRIDCKEWTEAICTTKTRPNCHHRHEIKCDTEYKEKCRNYVEQSCIDDWRRVCETTSNIVCEVQQKEIEVPYEEDECTTRQERRCEKHWEETSEGRKAWVDNPATCKLFDTTDCHPVTKYRTGYLVDDVCHDVPLETCKQVKDTQCHDVPQTRIKIVKILLLRLASKSRGKIVKIIQENNVKIFMKKFPNKLPFKFRYMTAIPEIQRRFVEMAYWIT